MPIYKYLYSPPSLWLQNNDNNYQPTDSFHETFNKCDGNVHVYLIINNSEFSVSYERKNNELIPYSIGYKSNIKLDESIEHEFLSQSYSNETFVRKFYKYSMMLESKIQVPYFWDDYIDERVVVTYGEIITELERKKKVITKPSDSYVSNDPRKFKFIDDENEYEVDCLGTILCENITSKILNIWRNNGFNEDKIILITNNDT